MDAPPDGAGGAGAVHDDISEAITNFLESIGASEDRRLYGELLSAVASMAHSGTATMDLKIAAIALVNDATLLTANKRDFEQVEGLRFENWLVP